MGSLVINNFPPAMFGGSAHQHSRESSGLPISHKSTPLRPVAHDGSTSDRDADQVDTPMTDAPPSGADAAALGYRAAHRTAPSHGTEHGGSQSQQHEAPPSPSVRPQQRSQPTVAASTGSGSFGGPRAVPPSSGSSVTSSPNILRSPIQSATASPRKIKVKSLSHIQSFAMDEQSPYSQIRSMSRRTRRDPNDVGPQYEISEMPVTDIIEMVAGLLTKITTTNDRQHEHLRRQIPPPEGTSGLSQQTTSVLAFHGKNVPSISILSYLSRIHKYCPTTYEVFLSLLVYFDRMAERVNSGPLQSLRQANQESLDRAQAAQRHDGSRHSSVSSAPLTQGSRSSPSAAGQHVQQATTPPPSGSLDKSTEPGMQAETSQHSQHQPPSPPQHNDTPLDTDPYNLSHFFVVDSFNIHRLVIAGVTCASKFFSDVFYTNSRYAKVCFIITSLTNVTDACSAPMLENRFGLASHANTSCRSVGFLL
jgi:PHO85 cyclin-6/7